MNPGAIPSVFTSTVDSMSDLFVTQSSHEIDHAYSIRSLFSQHSGTKSIKTKLGYSTKMVITFYLRRSADILSPDVRHVVRPSILFGVSGTAKAPSGFNATAAGGVYKAYLTSYIK